MSLREGRQHSVHVPCWWGLGGSAGVVSLEEEERTGHGKGPAKHRSCFLFCNVHPGAPTNELRVELRWESPRRGTSLLLTPGSAQGPGVGTLQLLRKKLKALRRNSTTSPSLRGTWSCSDRKVLVGLLGSCHRCSTEENRRPRARPGARLVESWPLTKSRPS